MPIKVSVKRTGAAGSKLTSERIERVFLSTCEEAVQALERLIHQELLKRTSLAEISEDAKARIPALGDLPVLLDQYRQCFRVETNESGARLILDRRKLREFGLPAILPELLEYGSEIGISPMAHLRTAWTRFDREILTPLARKVRRELV